MIGRSTENDNSGGDSALASHEYSQGQLREKSTLQKSCTQPDHHTAFRAQGSCMRRRLSRNTLQQYGQTTFSQSISFSATPESLGTHLGPNSVGGVGARGKRQKTTTLGDPAHNPRSRSSAQSQPGKRQLATTLESDSLRIVNQEHEQGKRQKTATFGSTVDLSCQTPADLQLSEHIG